MNLKSNEETREFMERTGLSKAEIERVITEYWQSEQDLYEDDYGYISDFLDEDNLYDLARRIQAIMPTANRYDITAIAMMVENLEIER